MWRTILVVSCVTVGAIKENEKLFKRTLDEYCRNNGADDDMAGEVLEAIKSSVKCIGKVVNLNTIRREVVTARQSSDSMESLNDVMAGYCGQSSELKTCVHIMSYTFSQCMSARVRGQIKGYNKAFDGLADYACQTSEGNINIAVFVHDDGVECMEKNMDELRDCTDNMKNNVFWEHCDDFDKFSNCVKKIAKKCPKRSVGELVENLLIETRAKSPCDKSYNSSDAKRRLKRGLLTESSKRELRTEHDETSTIIPIAPNEKERDLSLILKSLDENTAITALYENDSDWWWSLLFGSLFVGLHTVNTTGVTTATYENETYWSWSLFLGLDNNTTGVPTAPYQNKTDWLLLPGLRSSGNDALGDFKLSAAGLTKYRAMMRKYCTNSGGTDDDFDRMLREMGQCIRCLRNLVDPKRVKVEIEIARPFGRRGMKRIFVKYCEKTWRIKECIYSLTFKTVPMCMSDEAENYVTAYNSIIDMTINFWCYDGGDRIALYYSNEGPKCFTSQFATMQKCGDIFETTVFWKHCGKFPKFLNCVANAMRKCATPHPSRIVEALLTVIYRRSICYGGRKKPWATRPPPTGDYNY